MPATATVRLVGLPFSGVVGNDGVVRLVVAVSTLLGPEGTTLGRPCAGARGRADDPWFAGLPVICGAGGLPGGCLSVWLPGMAWSLIPFGSVVGRWWSAGVPGFGGWLWVVGWLWVENCIVDASILFSVVFSCLWLSCQGRTVDALAPGADEGRGRPR